ncbi:MAG: hypothetical protein WCW02_00285 [Candidatus Buchananbacteria bacterium]
MKKDIVKAAKEYMKRQTKKNRAPAWALTKIAVSKAKELFKCYAVDKKVVLTALYLAHLQFGEQLRQQKNHDFKSAKLAANFLEKFLVDKSFKAKVLNAIKAHHNKIKTRSLEAEVVKNAEAFKFLTLAGVKIMYQEALRRGYGTKEAKDYALLKMRQKYQLVTLPCCKKEAFKNRQLIIKFFK